jgi:hypothetical protein
MRSSHKDVVRLQSTDIHVSPFVCGPIAKIAGNPDEFAFVRPIGSGPAFALEKINRKP